MIERSFAVFYFPSMVNPAELVINRYVYVGNSLINETFLDGRRYNSNAFAIVY